MSEEPPPGSVGLVSEDERLAQIDASALKHAKHAMDSKHHLLSKQEEWEEEQKVPFFSSLSFFSSLRF